MLAAIARDEGPERFIVCVGYAGWSGGQLEARWRRTPGYPPRRRTILFETASDRVQSALRRSASTSTIGGAAGHA